MNAKVIQDQEVYEVVKTLEEEEALTFEGLCEDSLPDLANWLVELECLTREEADKQETIVFSGKQLNNLWSLSGKNRYPEDLTIICVSLKNFKNIIRLSIQRFAVGGRWFTDVRDNNLRREEEE